MEKIVKGEARKQIMDTAEALFANRGIEGVSLRTINSAAGVSPGVLHYHFGSREVLVAELINRHIGTLSQAIMERLRPLDLQPQPTVSNILKALILPLAELGLHTDKADNNYLGFIARLHLERSPLLKEVSACYQFIADKTLGLNLGHMCADNKILFNTLINYTHYKKKTEIKYTHDILIKGFVEYKSQPEEIFTFDQILEKYDGRSVDSYYITLKGLIHMIDTFPDEYQTENMKDLFNKVVLWSAIMLETDNGANPYA